MARLRPPNPIRSLRQSIEDRDYAPGRTDYLEDEPRRQSLDQLLPQIAAESEQAAKVARVPFLYYRKKRMGRRCSCYSVESSPDANCRICFGSGRVGGWDLHGCHTEWIEVTRENLKLVNVIPDFKAGSRPIYFTLEEGMNEGFIETEVPIVRNIGKVQSLQLGFGRKLKGNDCKVFIKTPTESVFTALTEASLAERLGEPKVVIRIELSRKNTRLDSPRFNHLMLRYKLLGEIIMYGDMPLSDSSFELGDLGFIDAFSSVSIFVPRAFDYLTTEDFLIRQTDLQRFKVTKINRNCVSEILLSHTLDARLLIPGTDPLVLFP